MRKILLVLKNEFLTVVMRRSFLLTLILIPMTSLIIILVVSVIQKSGNVDTGAAFQNLFSPSTKKTMEGYVDLSGLIKTIPPGYEDQLTRFASESEARDAVTKGSITAYYLIPLDYVATGKIIYVRPDFNPLSGAAQSGSIHALTTYNLVNGNLDLTYRIQNPVNLTEVDLSNTQRDETNWLTFFLPYVITFLFYIVILTSSSLLLSSISNEKTNRVMEILMTSVTPRQMLTGKIIALGLTGLLQTIVWLGSGLFLLKLSGRTFALAAAINIPVTILIWGIFFFIFGFAVYASLMAGIGALAPNMREGSQLTTIVIMPLVIPLIFVSSLLRNPDNPLAVFLSLFPLTSPVTMMMRLTATRVPFWQSGLALLLLAITAWLIVRASANLFKTQNLLSGKTLGIVGFLKAMAGR